MRDRKTDPRKQFSKKLAGRAEWFWFGYMVLLLALLAYRPEIGVISVYLALVVTVVMVVSVYAYTDNSKFEKALYAANEMARIKFTWKHKGTELVSAENVVEEESDDSIVEEDEAESDESDGGNG